MTTTELAQSLPPQHLVEQINEHHAACERSYLSALEHAVRAGSLLVQVRMRLPHGTWRTWLDECFAGSQRTAEGYIQLHHAYQQDPAALADAGGIRAALSSIARKVTGTQSTFEPEDEIVDAEPVSERQSFVTHLTFRHEASSADGAEAQVERLIERIDGTVTNRRTEAL